MRETAGQKSKNSITGQPTRVADGRLEHTAVSANIIDTPTTNASGVKSRKRHLADEKASHSSKTGTCQRHFIAVLSEVLQPPLSSQVTIRIGYEDADSSDKICFTHHFDREQNIIAKTTIPTTLRLSDLKESRVIDKHRCFGQPFEFRCGWPSDGESVSAFITNAKFSIRKATPNHHDTYGLPSCMTQVPSACKDHEAARSDRADVKEEPAPSDDDFVNGDSPFDGGDFDDMEAVLSSANISERKITRCLSRNFHKSAWPAQPCAQKLTGKELLDLLAAPPCELSTLPRTIINGLAPSTRQEHLRMLSSLSTMSPHNQTQILPIAITQHLMDESVKKEKVWRPTTLFKYHCTAQGALRLLPMYRAGAPSIALAATPYWQQAMRGTRLTAIEHIPKQAHAATVSSVREAMDGVGPRTLFSKQIRMVILIGWITAGRLGCVLQLKREDIVFETMNGNQRSIHITFRRGKGVRARQTHYTVTTAIHDDDWYNELHTFVNSKPMEAFLFSKDVKGAHLRPPLKRAGLEQRSLRRGALQAMASAKVDYPTLMNYSGHSSVDTLKRYLDFGRKDIGLQHQSLSAAAHLFQRHVHRDTSPSSQ